jgi:hypothetical protein
MRFCRRVLSPLDGAVSERASRASFYAGTVFSSPAKAFRMELGPVVMIDEANGMDPRRAVN